MMNSSAVRDYRALVRSTAGEVESIELWFLDPITGKKGSLTVNSFNGTPIFANDYIGTETLATVHTGVTGAHASFPGEGFLYSG